jgi:hypothetical protein
MILLTMEHPAIRPQAAGCRCASDSQWRTDQMSALRLGWRILRPCCPDLLC